MGDETLYTTQVLDNGTVVVFKNSDQALIIEPQIFMEGWKNMLVHESINDSRYDGIADLPKGGQVGFNSSVSISGPTLHVHYRFTPLNDVQVICVRAAIYLNYQDWIGAPYCLGQTTGRVPQEIQKGYFIAGTDGGPVSLGPAQPKGLTVRINDDGFHTGLEDDRNWGTYLGFMVNHGEPITPWDWKAGAVKDFDFTLTLNRGITPKTFPAKVPDKGLEGNWEVVSTPGIGKPEVKTPVGIIVRKDQQGKYSVTEYSLDLGVSGSQATSVTVKGRRLQARFDGPETLDLEMDPSETTLQGKRTWQDSSWLFKNVGGVDTFKYVRGADYLAPRLNSDGQVQTVYSYRPPDDLGDGWATGDLRNTKVNLDRIAKGINSKILTGQYPNFQGLVMAQHGKLLMDEYFYGFGPQDLHQLQSASKTVFSILFGIADDQGWVNPGRKLYDFFPEYRHKQGWDPKKDLITLGTILSMTSGFACDDWVPETDCHKEMWKTPDWLDFVLSQPMNHEPGEHFAYCNDCLEPLGAIVAKKSGLSIPDFAKKYLFDPLGIEKPFWFDVAPKELTDIAGALMLRPRDMAKLGQLYLQKGKWNGHQIVSENWVDESTKPRILLPKGNPLSDYYGYLWWTTDMPLGKEKTKVFFAAGLGGQYIFVVPDLELVCVLTGGNYDKDDLQGVGFFKTYILSAFK